MGEKVFPRTLFVALVLVIPVMGASFFGPERGIPGTEFGRSPALGSAGNGMVLAGGNSSLDWPTLFQNNARTAYRSEPLPPPLRWNRTYGSGGQLSPPVIWNNSLFYSTLGIGGLVNVSAISLQTGIERWNASITNTGMSVLVPGLTVSDGNVYLSTVEPGSAPGYSILSINAATGVVQWRRDEPGALAPGNGGSVGGFDAPAADGSDAIFVGEHDAVVQRRDGRTGTERWRVQLSSPPLVPGMLPGGWSISQPPNGTHLYSPVVSGGRVFVYGEHVVCLLAGGGGWNVFELGVVHALNATTGSTVWNRTIATTAWTGSRHLVAANGFVYAGRFWYLSSSIEENVSALDEGSGAMVWSYPLVPGIEIGHFGVGGEVLFLPYREYRGVFQEGFVAALNASSGTRLWTADLGQVYPQYLAGAGDTLYFSGWPSILGAIGISAHRLVWSRTAGFVGVPALAGDRLFVSTTQGVASYVRGDIPPRISWRSLAPLSTGRAYVMRGHLTIGDRVYVMGGWNNTVMSKSVEALNATTGTWTVAAPLPVATLDGIAQVVGGRIYIFGGQTPPGVTSNTWAYDPTTNAWSPRTPGVARTALASAVLNDKIYTIGGGDSGFNIVGMVDVYDPLSNSWSPRAQHPLPRLHMTAEALNGKIYTFGGDAYQDRVHVYDPGSNTWTEKSHLPFPVGFTNSVVVNGTVFLVGADARTVLRYDDANDTWIGPLDDLPTTRYTPAVSEALGRIYVIGGDYYGYENVTEEGTISWAGAPPQPATMLPARLVGTGFADVLLSWLPSPDDGGGARTLAHYEVWSGQNYDVTATSYSKVASVPPGTTSHVLTGEGNGDSLDHFYSLRAVNARGGFSSTTQQAGKFARLLQSGMNLVSIPLEQLDWTIGAVLKTVSWTSARTYVNDAPQGRWLSNFAAKSWSSWTLADRTMGIWVNVTVGGPWTIAGLVPSSTAITLKAGWNLIGYPSFLPRTLGGFLAGASYVALEGYAPAPPYDLTRLSASDGVNVGNGYWVETSGPDVTIAVSN